jgi:hypothetical protein
VKRLHILVEGQTEETLVRSIFRPHLEQLGWVLTTSVLTTKRVAGGSNTRGGVSSWAKIQKELRLLLRSRFDVLTTLFDYYGMPADAPGMQDRPSNGDAYTCVRHVEAAISKAIADPSFLPNLVLHETETWVFAAAGELDELLADNTVSDDLRRTAAAMGGPELVNDGPTTAPSKRLQARIPGYQKTLHGPLAIEALGLAGLRAQCPHLDEWLVRLKLPG